jgi:hypothetical protein
MKTRFYFIHSTGSNVSAHSDPFEEVLFGIFKWLYCIEQSFTQALSDEPFANCQRLFFFKVKSVLWVFIVHICICCPMAIKGNIGCCIFFELCLDFINAKY